MRVHLVAVAGAGMAPLAGLLRQAGHDVSGSDVAFDPPMGPLLAEWGVTTTAGWGAAALDGLDPARDLVVVGNVCRRDHPLVLEAERRGLRRVSLPTALRELVFQTAVGARPVVAVSGTHGKTTTTAMVAHLLADPSVGLESGYLIGGVPTGSKAPFQLGRTSRSLTAKVPLAPFVIEGDEYDSAFFEKVPKVWGYAPKIAVLTSVEHDHVDIYPDPESYLAAFRGLLERLPPEAEGGLLVANAGDAAVVELVEAARPSCRVVYYAAHDAASRPFPSGRAPSWPPTWTAHEVGLDHDDRDALQRFDLFVGPTSVGRYGSGAVGTHNISNALAAVVVAVEAFGLPVRTMASKLGSFRGVRRRLERRLEESSSSGVTLYDDFAHHPTAVMATLRAARARHPDRRLLAVYEPRSATACRAMHQEAYVEAFQPADLVFLAPLGRPAAASAENPARLDLDRLARDITASKSSPKMVHTPSSVDALVEDLTSAARAGDVLVVMSNGSFGGMIPRLLERLA